MEMVIPPRDHGPSTYRYTWDENGEVMQVTRVTDTRPSSTTERLTPGRQTAQWPFQSFITTNTEGTTIPSPTCPAQPRQQQQQQRDRRATFTQSSYSTWQPTQLRTSSHNSTGSGSSSSNAGPQGTDLVPDYVRNFLRGETPETVSSRYRDHQRNQSLYGGVATTPEHRGVDFVPQHRNPQHRSRVADFEGFQFHHHGNESETSLERVDSREAARGGAEEEEQQRFLGGEGEKGPGEEGGPGWRGLRRGGWRAGVALNVLVTFVVLITGFVCLIVAISGVSLSTAAGRSAVFVGSCGAARGVDWGLHAVVNVFVVVLVAAANYAFQVLSSPTREEVTAAHRRGTWLDIGVPSFRNLGRVEGSRALLAVVVLATAVFTQVMYNAVIFVSETAPNFKAAAVTESFVQGVTFNNDISTNLGGLSRPDLLTLQQQAARGELVRLSTFTCIDQFTGDFQEEYSAVLVVSSLDNPPLIQTSDGAKVKVTADLIPDRSTIQYCLARPAPAPTCEVDLNASLLGSVALLNSIALVATAAVLFKRPSSFRPLATLGDAISSFLEDPDPTTQGACLLSKTDIWQGRWPLTESKYWVPKNHYWLRSVSFPRWIATFSIWAVCVGLAAAGLAWSITYDSAARLSPFGTASPHALIPLPTTTPGAAAAVVASLPQLLLSVLYFATNSLLTTYYLSHESSLFAAGPPRPLRVSADAVGVQTQSLYLTLPRPVSWLLIALFAGMSFVLSQSLFAVSAHLVDVPLSPGALIPADDLPPSSNPSAVVVALGVSGVGLLALLVALVVLAVSVVALGLRRAPPAGLVNGDLVGNPMALPAGSCSVVISARCHPLAREKGLGKKPVMWGVVREAPGFGVSHCGFTAGRAGVLGAGSNYA